ncbi:MarR family winged helix-turn-helix transcriptional regulator [Oscillibacter sp.]|uniref:MarR family winged helix-turn-helix transcriptional regulator n=1 Tax=Oscillibacter sp. TaxID=1945593 RepID=UPI0026264723|nr:MarR family winged helix-turn-helix transcriptional regulator [Oscillibacter sp.]MDD3346541.1 MarR family winged helix-turn-helix transcriptional regulator [Oscillibacter sp.]
MPISYTQMLQFYQQFGKFYTRQFDPLLEQAGLSMKDVNVLLFLANNPEYDTARDVTLFRGLSKSQVSQAVEFLVSRGLLSRVPDRADRRIVHLTLTDAARPLVAEAQRIQNACGERLLSGFSPEEIGQLDMLLEKALRNGTSLGKGGLA